MGCRHAWRSITGGMAAIYVLLGLALAFMYQNGDFFLPIFLFALAFSTLTATLGPLKFKHMFNGMQGALWLVALGLSFLPSMGGFIWIFVALAITILLHAVLKPFVQSIVAALRGTRYPPVPAARPTRVPPAAAWPVHTPPPTYYMPSTPPPAYQPYERGYQPAKPGSEARAEEPVYPTYIQSYEQPQASYPQPLPPQQQP